MEIKSYKAEPTHPIIEKNIASDQNLSEAIPAASDESVNTKKKLLIQKPSNDEPKSKTGRKKVKEGNENKAPKRSTQDAKEVSEHHHKHQPSRDPEAIKMKEIEDMIEAMDPNFNNKKKAMKDLEFIFDPKKQEGNIPYYQEGNMEFYTTENEEKRKALKSNPSVVEALEKITNLYEFQPDGNLSKQAYIKVHTRLAKAIRKDLKEKAIGRLVEQDWKHDSKSKGYMTKQELNDSIFELVDIWTPEIDLYQYLAFFQQLQKVLKGEDDNLQPADHGGKQDNPYNILQ